MTNEELEEKYYPVTWEIAKGEIEIHCKNGKLLPSDHDIYSIEASFIQEQIKRYGRYHGDIECM
tara:strand:+ start:189 stop:380 length:192 start_codon:yes stop_codon:yes gene_type:complete